MIITRRSMFDGSYSSMDLPVTEEQMERYNEGEELIQNVFPNLTPGQREFIKTGVREEAWDKVMKEAEENEGEKND